MLHDARARRPSLTRRIDLIGLPTDAGASCRGAYLGPDALRAAGLPERLADIGFAVADLGDVNVGRKLSPAAEIDALAIAASEAGYRSLENGARPVFLGGDHSISMGSVAGVARHCAEIGQPLFVLWFDAHGDFNTWATTETGNIHGMSLARLCGEPGFYQLAQLVRTGRPANVMILGARAPRLRGSAADRCARRAGGRHGCDPCRRRGAAARAFPRPGRGGQRASAPVARCRRDGPEPCAGRGHDGGRRAVAERRAAGDGHAAPERPGRLARLGRAQSAARPPFDECRPDDRSHRPPAGRAHEPSAQRRWRTISRPDRTTRA